MRLTLSTLALWLAVGTVFALFGFVAHRLLGSGPLGPEQALLYWFESRAAEPWLGIARALTVVGTAEGYLPIAGIAVALLSSQSRRLAAFVATVVAGAGLYYVVFNRWLFARPRPEIVPNAQPFEGTSFPSGHAVVTTALALALVVAVVEIRPRWRLPAAALAVLVVGAVLLTRLYLLAHYPTDLFAGVLLGLAWAFGTWWLWKRRASGHQLSARA